MTTVFLTGASGFLGGHLLRELCEIGCTVRALSRRPDSDTVIGNAGGTPVRGDLANVDALHAGVAGCDAVFHVAADTRVQKRYETEQFATNVTGTELLLRVAQEAGVSAFMHTSSVSAFSHLVHETIDESTPQRGDESWVGYERSKYLGEQVVKRSTLPWIVFNPSHILGPGDRHNWARLIMLIDREKLPGIPPGIGAFADVRQVARAQVRAWQRQRFGQCYVLGGEHASFVDFVHRVGAALGRRTPRRALPAWLLMTFARATAAASTLTGKDADITPGAAAITSHQLHVDSRKARRELDYVETPLDDLLADTLDWMRQQGMLGGSSHPET